MLSKPMAALLLVAALAAAALAGGYIATKSFKTQSEEELTDKLVPLDPPATPGPAQPGGGPGSAKAGRPAPDRKTEPPSGGGAPAPADSAGRSTGTSPAPGRGEPAPVTFEEVEVPAGQLVDIQLQSPLSTDSAKVEDRVETRVLKEVKVGAVVAIPAGAKIVGSVTLVEKGGRLAGPAKIGVRFSTLVVQGSPDAPLVIDPLFHEGPSPAGDSKMKIGGGAAGGAAIGWLKGGLSGALKGAAVGGGAGATGKMVEGRKPAELPAGAQARVELRAPVQVTVRR